MYGISFYSEGKFALFNHINIYKRVSIDFINMLFFEMVEKFKIELYRKSIIVQQNDEGWVSYYKLTKFKIA